MNTLVVNRNITLSFVTVMLLIYGLQGISYGQGKAPTVTPGENNTSLVVSFSGVCDEDENAYQVQLRRKSPQGEWTTKCTTVYKTESSLIFIFWVGGDCRKGQVIFTNLEPGVTYEARYRDTNLSECPQNPPNPALWSAIGEGTTHLVPPPRVEFVDANLAYGVRRALGLSTSGGHIDLLKIPEASLPKLTELESSDQNITDLTGLEHATQLADLDLSYNQISDVTPLAHLTELIYLDLSDNQISDTTPLAQLTQLTELELDRNQISDITPLAQLTQLTELTLWDNQISDIAPLVGLSSLRWLSLTSNQIRDVALLTTFASRESLRTLLLSGNPIADVSPVRELKRENPNLGISIDIPVILTDPGGEPDLYVIADGSILQLNLNELNDDKISPQSLRTYDIAIDGINSKIYWATRDDIQRANFDGTNVQDVVTGLDEPEDIAIDVSGGKIYWTIEHGDRIQRANLDGTNVQDVVTGLDRPYGIAIDISGGKIYWMEEDDHRIQRANLDGTNVQDVVTGLDEPEDIAIDVSVGKIYWAEGRDRRIQRANLDGSDAHVIVPDLDGAPRGITLDIASSKIYWTDYSNNGVWRANLDGTNAHVVAIGVSNPTAIGLHDGTVNIQATPTAAITDAVVSISPASVASPAVGQQLQLSLKITDGEAVAGYQATVQFDRTLLRYVSSANGDYLPAGAFFVEPTVEGNLVKLNAASLAGESTGDGTLATITFEVITLKGSTLTLSDVLLTDTAGEAFVPTVENAEITESIQSKGDINGDGMVNIQDLVLVASNLGKTGQNTADVNGDRIVNIQDLVLVAGALGNSAAAPSLHLQSLDTLTAADVKKWLSEAQQWDLKDITSQRGILFLQQLLITLTPKETALLPNYPNPFNPETWIPYHLVKDANVTLHIYAVNGTLVRTLTLGHQPAGMYQSRSRAAYWDGRNAFGEPVASGIYFYTLTAGDFIATRKMLIRK